MVILLVDQVHLLANPLNIRQEEVPNKLIVITTSHVTHEGKTWSSCSSLLVSAGSSLRSHSHTNYSVLAGVT